MKNLDLLMYFEMNTVRTEVRSLTRDPINLKSVLEINAQDTQQISSGIDVIWEKSKKH